MAQWQTQNQGFLGGGPGSASWMADPDILSQGAQQQQLARQQQQGSLDTLAKQQQYAATQAQADRQFQAEQAGANRSLQGQLLGQQGDIASRQAAANFGYTSQLAGQQNQATSALHQQDFGNTRTLGADQFGYTAKLAEQQNAFQQALLGQTQSGQRQLSAQEAAQQQARDAEQYGYTNRINQGQYTQQSNLQRADLLNRTDLAKLQDSGESGRLAMQVGQQRYATDQQTALGRQQLQTQQAIAQGPLDFAKSKFAAILPMLQGAIAGGGGAGGYSSTSPQFDPSRIAGSAGAPRQVYTPQQTAEQVNAAEASNARRATEQSRQVQQSAAARGTSTRSAATQGLLQGIESGRMGEDATAAREIPFQSAQANTDASYRAAALDEQARQANIAGLVNQRQIQATQRNGLLAALAGLA